MIRNALEQADKGKAIISRPRELLLGEVQQMMNIFDKDRSYDGVYNAILTAFYFGFAVGYRQAQGDIKKRKNKRPKTSDKIEQISR